jgi:DNA-binding NarL/FixJ family response regulator
MPSDRKVRVVIADDHPIMRVGIRQILERCPDIRVIGEAENGKEALGLVEELTPDVLILDINMPVMGGIEALEILQRQKPEVNIIILSAYDDRCFISETCAMGARGYYLKEEAPAVIVDAVLEAAEARPFR